METFRSGGPGGQNQNKRNTGVRFKHSASGAVGESREYRTQHQNKVAAFKRMAESKEFKKWAKIEAARIESRLHGKPTIEETVEKAMSPENLRVEVKDSNGKWTIVPSDDDLKEIKEY